MQLCVLQCHGSETDGRGSTTERSGADIQKWIKLYHKIDYDVFDPKQYHIIILLTDNSKAVGVREGTIFEG